MLPLISIAAVRAAVTCPAADWTVGTADNKRCSLLVLNESPLTFFECAAMCESLGGTMPCMDSRDWHKDLSTTANGKQYWSGAFQRPTENTNGAGWDNWHAAGCTNNTYLRQIGHFDDYGSGTTCRAQEACGFLNLDGESTASSTRTMHDAQCDDTFVGGCMCEWHSERPNTPSANYTRDKAKLKAESGDQVSREI